MNPVPKLVARIWNKILPIRDLNAFFNVGKKVGRNKRCYTIINFCVVVTNCLFILGQNTQCSYMMNDWLISSFLSTSKTPITIIKNNKNLRLILIFNSIWSYNISVFLKMLIDIFLIGKSKRPRRTFERKGSPLKFHKTINIIYPTLNYLVILYIMIPTIK